MSRGGLLSKKQGQRNHSLMNQKGGGFNPLAAIASENTNNKWISQGPTTMNTTHTSYKG
jgi:hypothetical protein